MIQVILPEFLTTSRNLFLALKINIQECLFVCLSFQVCKFSSVQSCHGLKLVWIIQNCELDSIKFNCFLTIFE
eukprot:m.338596 g.338596  ORF g.338596 m.338596 type:complete len:73 (-) comp18471_c0_seq1:60-278(-)